MKTKIFGSLALLLVASQALGAAVVPFTADEVNLMNSHWGPVPRQLQLGTKLLAHETALNLTQNLSSGKILLGNGSNVAAPVTPTGDVTIDNAGVTAIGAGKVLQTMLVAPGTAGLNVERIAHAVWDPSGVAGQRTVAAHGLGVSLPDKAIITQSWFHTKTSVVSTNNDGTVAFSCDSANNILSAADIDSSSGVGGQITTGVSTGTAANMKLVAACEITATVAVDAFTAGKIDIFVRYVVSE